MIRENRPVNILLIDDNPGDIRLTKEALKEGTTPTQLNAVMDGEEALKYLFKQSPYEASNTPDIILLDLNLPKLNGKQVLAKIKIDDHLKSIPVIMLTTSKAKEDIMECYQLHVNCYLTKPIDFDSYIELIKQIENFWMKTANLPSLVS